MNADSRLVIVMAGLPGTGKSAIAAELAKKLPALALNKDDVRARLFPAAEIAYSRKQDDLCMDVVFLMTESVLKANPGRAVIIDGRTFSQSYQVEHLLARFGDLRIHPVIIECTCGDAVARQRLEQDRRAGIHPAANRSFVLYSELKANAQPIAAERLVVDTGRELLAQSVERCMAYIHAGPEQWK
jgi:predicted kinase